jgi:hypothetical protein
LALLKGAARMADFGKAAATACALQKASSQQLYWQPQGLVENTSLGLAAGHTVAALLQVPAIKLC